MILRWKKGGLVAYFHGFTNTKTGVLRPPTQNEIDQFISDFKGKEFLEEPFTVVEKMDGQ